MSSHIITEWLSIPVDGQPPASAYSACPAGPGRYPAIIVGMELFGITRHVRNVVDRLAEAGFVAVAPDFYHRSEPGVDLAYDEAGRTKGFQLLGQLTRADALADVRVTMDFLRDRTDCRKAIGFLGFSVGGHIGYLASTAFDLAAVAVFYPGWLPTTDIALSLPDPTLSLTAGIAANGGQILFLVGERDFLIAEEQRNQIKKALEENGVRHEVIVYPAAQHGFFCDERDTFDIGARDDAWSRVIALFSSTLTE